MTATFLLAWLRAFLLTQVVEMGVYAQATSARPLRERLAIAFGASGITHPLVWFVIVDAVAIAFPTTDVTTSRWMGIAVAEAFALTVEAAWLFLFGVRPLAALGWSLLANGASFTIGLFLYERGGW